MEFGVLIRIAYESIVVLIQISVPLLSVAIVVGLTISILQTTTSIQEQTLTFVPKFLAIILSLLIFGNWILKVLIEYITRLINSIPSLI